MMSDVSKGLSDKETAALLVTKLDKLCITYKEGLIANQLRYCRSLLVKGAYWGYPSILSLISGFVGLAENDEDRQIVFDTLEELVILAEVLPPIDKWEPLYASCECKQKEKKEEDLPPTDKGGT